MGNSERQRALWRERLKSAIRIKHIKIYVGNFRHKSRLILAKEGEFWQRWKYVSITIAAQVLDCLLYGPCRQPKRHYDRHLRYDAELSNLQISPSSPGRFLARNSSRQCRRPVRTAMTP